MFFSYEGNQMQFRLANKTLLQLFMKFVIIIFWIIYQVSIVQYILFIQVLMNNGMLIKRYQDINSIRIVYPQLHLINKYSQPKKIKQLYAKLPTCCTYPQLIINSQTFEEHLKLSQFVEFSILKDIKSKYYQQKLKNCKIRIAQNEKLIQIFNCQTIINKKQFSILKSFEILKFLYHFIINFNAERQISKITITHRKGVCLILFRGYKVDVVSDKTWVVQFLGPPSTPYEGGKYQIVLEIPEGYPFSSPKAKLKTNIFHPNIDIQGNFCQEMIGVQNYWAGQKERILFIVQKIISALIRPNNQSAILNQQAVSDNYKQNSTWWGKARERNNKFAK